MIEQLRLIKPREHLLMGLALTRSLPTRVQRQCGPFVFLDHFGPHQWPQGQGMDVPPHPHIGLSTLTWLLEGTVLHRDSLGNEVIIQPGAVNWMTAGRGIVHSERTPDHDRTQGALVHGLQCWVALPEHLEQADPSFEQHLGNTLPRWTSQQANWILIAGQAFGRQSPVAVASPLALLDVRAYEDDQLVLPTPSPTWQWGVYVLQGDVQSDGQNIPVRHLAMGIEGRPLNYAPDSHFMLIGGEPLGKRFMDWNFLATQPHLIDQARQAWINHDFPSVINDTGYVPYPNSGGDS